MEIRLATEKDIPAVKELWYLCFPEDGEAFTEWYFKQRFSPKECICMFEDDVLVANVQVVPQMIMFRDKPIVAGMIVGAATHPQWQRKGLMKKLLRVAFLLMQERDYPVSILYPFLYSFYQKMGYGIVSDRTLFHYKEEQLIQIKTDSKNVLSSSVYYQKATEQDVVAMHTIYEQCMHRFQSHSIRHKRFMQFRYEETIVAGGYALIDHHYEWYVLYSIEKNQVVVAEWAYTSLDAQKNALLALMQEHSHCDIITPTSTDDVLIEHIDEVRGSVQWDPFLMLRTVNPMELLKDMKADEKAQITLRIEDSFFEGTNQAISIHVNDDMHIETEEVGFGMEDVLLSSLDFSRWVCGYVSAQQLAFEGIANASLLSFLHKQNNYFVDMY